MAPDRPRRRPQEIKQARRLHYSMRVDRGPKTNESKEYQNALFVQGNLVTNEALVGFKRGPPGILG
jgi:hypothetical protein